MTEPEGMDELRARLRRAEDDARAARFLAGGADRDTAELRTELREFRTQNNRLLTALRADLSDLRTDLTGLGEHVARGFAEMRGKFDASAAGQQQIVDILTAMIERGDDRPS